MEINIEPFMLKTQAAAIFILGFGKIAESPAAVVVGMICSMPAAIYYSVKFYKEFIQKKK
jgi:hypothetical protein